MENRVQLIERVMRKVRLPTATLESVRTALSDPNRDPSEFSCKPVYLEARSRNCLIRSSGNECQTTGE